MNCTETGPKLWGHCVSMLYVMFGKASVSWCLSISAPFPAPGSSRSWTLGLIRPDLAQNRAGKEMRRRAHIRGAIGSLAMTLGMAAAATHGPA